MYRHLRRHSGFTIFELMLTLGVAAVIAAIAVPNVRDFIRNNRLSSVANDLLRGTQVARSEAAKRQANVAFCATTNPSATAPTCSYGAFRGWIVFEDTNNNWQADSGDVVINRHDLVDASVTVVNDNGGIVSYGPSGFANPPGTKTPTRNIVICDSRGNADLGTNSAARAVLIEATGRSRVTKLTTEISTAMGTAGACPE
jgi:type IV fimbrial biogenesis protein FimT